MQFAKKLYRGLFPKPLILDTKEQALLAALYPTVDWNYVRCYEGMPWFMLKSFAIATALPHSYNGKYINIYFRSYQPNTFISTSTLVHEAYHVLQYSDLKSMGKNTWGWGFFRRFVSYYIGWYLAQLLKNLFNKNVKLKELSYQAYRYHEMEVPAYDYEKKFGEYFDEYRHHDSTYLLNQAPKLRLLHSHSRQRPPLWAWLLGSLIALVLGIIKPIADCLILVIAVLFGGRSELD